MLFAKMRNPVFLPFSSKKSAIKPGATSSRRPAKASAIVKKAMIVPRSKPPFLMASWRLTSSSKSVSFLHYSSALPFCTALLHYPFALARWALRYFTSFKVSSGSILPTGPFEYAEIMTLPFAERRNSLGWMIWRCSSHQDPMASPCSRFIP